MKVYFYRSISLLLSLLLILAPLCAAQAQEAALPYTLTESFTGDENASCVSFPVLTGGDENICSAINSVLSQEAFLPQYQSILSGLTAGSTGIRVSFDASAPLNSPIASRYLSLCIIAEGKQPQGRPGQCRYTFTFDLATGEQVPFEALCTDPDTAMEQIETYILDQVTDEISDYMEFASLSPVPFEHYFCDGQGNITFCYDRSDFTFLSGSAGAVTIPAGAFPDVLDLSEEGVLTALLDANQVPLALRLIGAPLEETLDRYHATFDSCYYVSGEAYTVEEPALRGTYLIAGSDEDTVSAVLITALIPTAFSRSVTDMTDPAPRTLDESAAEAELVSPGTAYQETEPGYIFTYYFNSTQELCAIRIEPAS